MTIRTPLFVFWLVRIVVSGFSQLGEMELLKSSIVMHVIVVWLLAATLTITKAIIVTLVNTLIILSTYITVNLFVTSKKTKPKK